MFGSCTTEFLEEVAVVLALIVTNFIYAVYAVFTSHLMSLGVTPLFLTIYGSLAIAFFLFPLSFCFERNIWPREFSLKLMVQLLLLSFGGVTLFQILMLNGVKKTSPAVATAMPNLAPGFIFIIAWVFRFETVNLKCMYGVFKLIGTLVCTVGAISMSLLHDSTAKTMPVKSQADLMTVDHDRVIGTVYLMGAVIILSCTIVLQAVTLGDFPAPMSLSAATAFIGALLTAVIQLIQNHKLEIGTPLVSGKHLIGYALMGGAISGACSGFQTWAMKKKGPVFVSTFNPIGTVFSVILSAITLGESITFGSLLGMFLMFSGLYCVLWAKRRENYNIEDEDLLKLDDKKPLLG
ncbi:Wat1-related protein [Thalictrum thalictroides]|uniref:WAT1-related protein n=1 Tax=Thalictrum thalictroides TaxID=46969 RepID=A0A7J6XCM8_THATH|nr:Wat1-related protein [Thalictrum thalictroides]